MTRTMHTLHRWLGLVAGLLVLVAAGTAIGLNHQDLWKGLPAGGGKATSPYQKYVLSVAADPSDPNRILAGTHDGLFRSLDGGTTWEEAVLPVPAEGVNTIQFDPGRPGIVYVALRAIGVFRSADHGEVWEEVTLPFYPPEGTHVAGLSLGRDGALVLATTDGLFRQSRPGGGWQHARKAEPAAAAHSRRWLQLVYDLHDGRIWGTYGVPITDAVSVALILLVISGYALFLFRAGQRRHARRRSVTILADSPPVDARVR